MYKLAGHNHKINPFIGPILVLKVFNFDHWVQKLNTSEKGCITSTNI